MRIQNVDVARYSSSLRTRIMESLGAESSYTSDSLVNIISEVFSQESANYVNQLNTVLDSMSVLNAKNSSLDTLAYSMYGLSRYPARKASVKAGDYNIYFTVARGKTSFGDINDGASITIPAGTILSTSGTENSVGGISYIVSEEVILSSNSNVGYVSAISVGSGKSYNLNKGLNYHNFSDYYDFDNNTLLVSNTYPILNGSDAETDENFRFRIINHLNSLKSTNYNNVLFSSLNVPGIINVKIINSYFGVGTAAVVCFGQAKQSNTELVRKVQNILDAKDSNNFRFIAIEPRRLNLDIKITLSMLRVDATDEIKNRIQNIAQENVINFFNQRIGENNYLLSEFHNNLIENINVFLSRPMIASKDYIPVINASKVSNNSIIEQYSLIRISDDIFLQDDEMVDVAKITFDFKLKD